MSKLNVKEKLITLAPLAVIGIYVQILGVLMPFQIKFHNMQLNFQVNEINYPMYLYTNLLPRFSPIINQSKNLIKVVRMFPKTLDRGEFNVRFIDGVDFAFNVGPERWRSIDKKGYILFDSTEKSMVNDISFVLINHPIATTKATAKVDFYLNDELITSTETPLKIGEKRTIALNLDGKTLKEKDNLLFISSEMKDYQSYFDKKQILAITQMSVNNQPVNLESIDVPHLSPVGPALTNTQYRFWGGEFTNPWISWHIHTQVFERTPNFWWLFPFYYWDIPKSPILALFVFNTLGLIYFTRKLFTT